MGDAGQLVVSGLDLPCRNVGRPVAVEMEAGGERLLVVSVGCQVILQFYVREGELREGGREEGNGI